MSDSEQIETLIREWAAAVHRGDMEAVVAGHAADIVMFDVPPPYEGIRGLDAYARTWPPFFSWQAQGAVFEIESLEVETGGDVAFAYALLRCGTAEEFAENPANRLRLTIGLRREDVELYTFGDSWNDLSMHDTADLSHSFLHSPEDVKAATNHVIGAVADALPRYM